MDTITIIIGLAGLSVGAIVGYVLFKSFLKQQINKAEGEGKLLLEDAKRKAESVKRDKLLEAKEKYLQKKSEFEDLVSKRNKKFDDRDKQINEKERSIQQRQNNLKSEEDKTASIRDNLNRQLELVSVRKTELDKFQEEHRGKLEKIATITAAEAKNELIESLKEEARTASLALIKDIVDEAKLKANKEAKKIVIQTIQRTAAEHTIENSVSIFNLDSDDQKGQIIGREGRNIRALEAATGVEIIVDDNCYSIHSHGLCYAYKMMVLLKQSSFR